MVRKKGNLITSGISLDQRITTVGHTGTGKTFLLSNLLDVIPHKVPIIVFDGKSEWKPPSEEWEVHAELPTHWEREIHRQRKPKLLRLVIRPFEEWYPDVRRNWPPLIDLWNRIWQDGGPCLLYIDEIQTTCDEHRTSGALHRLVTMGRVRDIAVWGGTQRPALVPRVFMSEADHFFGFRLRDQADRDRASEILGEEAKENPGPGEHDFWYRGPDVKNERPFLVHQGEGDNDTDMDIEELPPQPAA